MIVKQFLLNVIEANAFICACEKTHDAMLVDAGEWNPAIPAYLEAENLTLKKIFITHNHGDHTAALPEILKAHDVPVIASLPEIEGIKTEIISDGETVDIGKYTARVALTPGHTPDGVSLIFPDTVFAGDALFAGSVGGTKSDELAEQQLAAIRKELFTLPPDTKVYVGHGPATTIAIESQYNPFFV
jgi:glyoxylase-like metal-dependent hydrolase (beta-lactamase superfamily II)